MGCVDSAFVRLWWQLLCRSFLSFFPRMLMAFFNTSSASSASRSSRLRRAISFASCLVIFVREALIKSLSYFVTSIIMQDKEKDDENSELFKESAGARIA